MFLVVGACSLILKITLFIISRNIYPNTRKSNSLNSSMHIQGCTLFAKINLSTNSSLNSSLTDAIDCTTCECVDTVWIWAMLLIIIAPYLQTCGSCLSRFSIIWEELNPIHIPSLIFVSSVGCYLFLTLFYMLYFDL